MLRLNAEQFERLQQLTVERHARRIGGVLAQAWPAVTERLQDRWPAFVEAAMQQARRHGIADAVGLAHYTGLWCLWGARFEDKPAFAWAREILDDPRRKPALKLHQLLQHTRGERAQQQPTSAPAAGITLAQFDAAAAQVEAQALTAAAREVFPAPQPPARLVPCDLAGIDLMVADAEVQAWRLEAGQWQRQPLPKPAATRERLDRAPDAPLDYAVLSTALRGGAPSRLNLALATLATCDARVHPQVLHVAPGGRLAWKGRDATRLSIALNVSPLSDGEGWPGMAAAPAPDLHRISIDSCGLRDAGAPFGTLAIGVRAYAAAQWLTEVRHAAWPALQRPATAPQAVPAPVCRLERDGETLDAAGLQHAWAELHTRFAQGMDKLFAAWMRVVETTAPDTPPRLNVQAQCLAGQAGVTWGYLKTDATTVKMRTEGAIDMTAIALDLQLSGELTEGATRSRVRLSAQGSEPLRRVLRQLGEDAAEAESLEGAVCAFRLPFALEVDPIATSEPATAGVATTVPQALGALAGECGLRPRADGRGWQWFFSLRIERCAVVLALADPMVGDAWITRELLAAQPLVDWSAG